MKLIAQTPSKINSKTIVMLYFDNISTIIGLPTKPVGKEWASYCSRVNAFRERADISWEQYYTFVSDIFTLFVPKGYRPTFGIICSLKVYTLYVKRNWRIKNHKHQSFNFKALQDQLYCEKFFDSI